MTSSGAQLTITGPTSHTVPLSLALRVPRTPLGLPALDPVAVTLISDSRGARGARSVKRRGSSQDLTDCGFEPRVGVCDDSSEPGACFRLCVPLSVPPLLMLSLRK